MPCQFATPAGTAYVSIAYGLSLVNQGEAALEKISSDPENGKDEEETVPANSSTDPNLSQGEHRDGYTLTPSKSTYILISRSGCLEGCRGRKMISLQSPCIE